MPVPTRMRSRGEDLPGLPPLLAAAVVVLVVTQSAAISDSFQTLSERPFWTLPSLAICVAATLLGHSAARTRTTGSRRQFIEENARRLVPPYFFVVLSSTFLLGPLASNFRVVDYVTAPQTYLYLLNLAAVPQYQLPGVFDFNNQSAIVNANVWAAPFYVAVGLIVCALSERRFWRLIPPAVALAVIGAALSVQVLDVQFDDAYGLTAVAVQGDGLSATLCGLLGVIAAQFFPRMRMAWKPAGLAIAVLGGAILVGNASWVGFPAYRVVSAIAVAYLTVCVAARRLPLSRQARRLMPFLSVIYLISFPIQQLATQFGPRGQNAFVNLLLAAPPAIGISVVFWYTLGRRALSQSQLSAQARSEASSEKLPLPWKFRRPRLDTFLPQIVLGGFLIAVFMGIMVLMYIAMQPAPEGI